jgi:hypothetical protein
MLVEMRRVWSRYLIRDAEAAEAQTMEDVITIWTKFSKEEASRGMDDVKREWSGFLIHANRVLVKLEQGAKNTPSQPWFGTITHRRRTDPLLVYLHQARDASEHGDVIRGNDVVVRHGPGRVQRAIFTPDALAAGGGSAGSTLDLPTVALLPVTTRGRTYQPPMEHLGQPIIPAIHVVAEAMLIFLTKVVEEAKSRILP